MSNLQPSAFSLQPFLSRLRPHLPAIVLLTLLPAAWWHPLLRGMLPDFMDTVTQLYPMRLAAAHQIRSGTLPLWLPNIFSGTPLLANPQISVLYPPQLLFYIAPGPLANGLICLFHYVLGGLGAYFFVRRRAGAGLGAGLFAGVTFQFSAMLVSRIALTPHLYTTVWVPWLFLASDCAVRERTKLPGRASVAVAVLLAMQVLAGAPQITFYTAIALSIYWLAHISMGTLGSIVTRGILTGALAFLLASAQLLPSAEFLRHAERASIAVDQLRGQALGGEFVWRALVGYTGPTIEDTDSINAIGPGAMALAVLALFARRRRTAVALWAISVLSYLLALGVLAPLWNKMMPLYSGFHAPRRSLVLWSICGPLLAGLGAHRLRAFARARRWPRMAYPAALMVLTAGTWWMLPRLERVFTDESRFEPNPRVIEAIGEDRFVTVDPTFNYSYASRRESYGHSMLPDLACWHGTHDVNGYDPLVLKRYALARNVATARSGRFYPSHGAFLTDPASPVLALLNTQYLVGRYDLFEPGRLIAGTSIDQKRVSALVETAVQDDQWPLFRYKEKRPLAWAVERVVREQDAETALLRALANDPFVVACVEEDIEFSAPKAPALTATRVDARTFALKFAGPLAKETLVVVSNTWMPGWKGRSAAGDELPTMAVDGFLTGVLVPAGASEATVRYAPPMVFSGCLLSLAGIVLTVVCWRNGNGQTRAKGREKRTAD